MEIANFTCAAPGSSGCDPSHPPSPGASGTIIANNIIAHSASSGKNGHGIHLYPAGRYGFQYPATSGITVTQNIICDWPTRNKQPIFDEGAGNRVSKNVTSAAKCDGLGFSEPNRSVGNYYTSIGGPPQATTDDFLKQRSLIGIKIAGIESTLPAVSMHIFALDSTWVSHSSQDLVNLI